MWIYRLEKTTLSTQEGGPAKRDKTPDPSTGDGGPDKRYISAKYRGGGRTGQERHHPSTGEGGTDK